MTDHSQVLDLLLHWEEMRDSGTELTPEDLCAEVPELVDAVRGEIDRLRRMDRRLQVEPTVVSGLETAKPQRIEISDGWLNEIYTTLAQSPNEREATRRKSNWAAHDPSPNGYQILGVLGRGGMGVVFKARQNKANRTVALKMILGSGLTLPSEIARFRSEAEAIAGINHPNIVQIYEVGEHAGLPYFSLEYCPNGTLKDRLREDAIPARDAAALVEKSARGIAAAHARGIIHRDLKPANVLLADDGTPKIADFGLAKRIDDDSGNTKTGAIMGTPCYMAPEQAAGEIKALGPACDVYALGAILYECLTGRPPFKATTALEMLEQVRSREPVSPRLLQPTVPRDLETICLKCLRKEEVKRYATAAALADDLIRFLAGKPIVARPVGSLERATKWVNRNPVVAAMIAAIALIVAVGSAGIYLKYREAKEHEQRADRLRMIAEANAETAQENARRAEYEADTAKQASRFLEGLFKAPDPLQISGYTAVVPRYRGEELSARQMLMRGAKQITPERLPDPRLRAHLLERVGRSCIAAGEYALADEVLREARRIRSAAPDDPDLAETHHSLGWLAHLRGNYDEAKELCTVAKRVRQTDGTLPIVCSFVGKIRDGKIELEKDVSRKDVTESPPYLGAITGDRIELSYGKNHVQEGTVSLRFAKTKVNKRP